MTNIPLTLGVLGWAVFLLFILFNHFNKRPDHLD